MSKMKELYEKVSKDPALQAKFAEVLRNSEKTGEDAANEKLLGFAKDAEYEVTIEEVKVFFSEPAASTDGALSDSELDMVAGGKSEPGKEMVWNSIMTFGGGCALVSVMAAAVAGGDECSRAFK